MPHKWIIAGGCTRRPSCVAIAVVVAVAALTVDPASARGQFKPDSWLQVFADMSKAYAKAKHGDREAIHKQMVEIDSKVAAQEWALSRFQRESRTVERIANPDWYTQLMYRSKEAKREYLVHHPDAVKGEIITGTALNFFLDECGAAAVAHQLILDREPAGGPKPKAGPGTPAGFGGLGAGQPRHFDPTKAEEARRQIVFELAGVARFTMEDLNNVIVKRGFAGKTFKVKLNDQPLPLDWPEVLRDNKELRPLMDELATTKELALNELAARPADAQGVGLSPGTSLRFRRGADRLYSKFTGELEEQMKFGMHPGDRVDWVIAQRYLLELSRGVARFCEARNSSDVTVPNFPPAGKSVSIVEVIGFMSRHGYRFGETDDTGWESYNALYREMRRYYVDLYAIRAALNENRAEKKDLIISEAILIFRAD